MRLMSARVRHANSGQSAALTARASAVSSFVTQALSNHDALTLGPHPVVNSPPPPHPHPPPPPPPGPPPPTTAPPSQAWAPLTVCSHAIPLLGRHPARPRRVRPPPTPQPSWTRLLSSSPCTASAASRRLCHRLTCWTARRWTWGGRMTCGDGEVAPSSPSSALAGARQPVPLLLPPPPPPPNVRMRWRPWTLPGAVPWRRPLRHAAGAVPPPPPAAKGVALGREQVQRVTGPAAGRGG